MCENWRFTGKILSDYGGINNAHEVQRIGETIGETGLLAMEAGMDIEMPKATGYGDVVSNFTTEPKTAPSTQPAIQLK